MPTYEYKCEACGHAFERFQAMSAAPVKRCPECGKLKVRRLIGAGAGMIFKGSGFYITDYRSEGYKESAKADSGGNAAPATGDAAASGDKKSAETKASDSKSSESKSSDSKSSESQSSAKSDSKPAAAPAPRSESKSQKKDRK